MNWFNLYVNTCSTVKFLCIQHKVTQSINSSEGIQNIVKLLKSNYRSLNFIFKIHIFQTRYMYFIHVVPSTLCFRSSEGRFQIYAPILRTVHYTRFPNSNNSVYLWYVISILLLFCKFHFNRHNKLFSVFLMIWSIFKSMFQRFKNDYTYSFLCM